MNPGRLLALGLESTPAASGWTPPTPEELDWLLPQYRIEKLIGSGGMGAVYKGVQPVLDRPAAIKLLPAEMTDDAQFIGRFEREARILAQIAHPNIVAVYDFGRTAGGHPYFVMEHVDGTDLRRILQTTGIEPDRALSVICQVCDALEAAHDLGIIHRDIKPENILIAHDGTVKLADFGLARPVQDDARSITCASGVLGTPDYMAPEQRAGHADERADIFALGVVLYEMLAGQPPRGVFSPPSRKAGVDARIDGIVNRALQEDPADRYQRIGDFKADIDRLRSTLAGKQDGKPKRVARKPRVFSFVIVAVALAIPVLLITGKGARERAARPRAALDASLGPYRSQPGWNENRVTALPDGTFSVDLNHLVAGDLSVFKGLRVSALNLNQNMLDPDRLADLRALRGLRLKELNIAESRVTDLSPLRGMPLEALDISNTPVADLAPLAGMKLRRLILRITPASDLGPLAGMPLEKLDLANATNVSDITPLRGAPLTFLSVMSTGVVDISVLAGMPLKDLRLLETEIADISVLAACPDLENLNIYATKITDLAPLAGHHLTRLTCCWNGVTSLEPLRGQPLRYVKLDGLKVADVSPLADCRELEEIILPRAAKNPETLRKLPRLRLISTLLSGWSPKQTATEFWKEYDAKQATAATARP